MTGLGVTTEAPVAPAVTVQVQQESAERTLKVLKNIMWLALVLFATGFSCYWWGRIDEARIQKEKVKDLQAQVIEKQVPVVKKVYEDRIVYKDRVETIEVPKIIEKKVYHNVCLDDEGVDAFNKMMKP